MNNLVIAIFLLSTGASFVQRTTGFGFGIFIMTMLPYLMPTYGEATTLSGILALTTSAVIVWRLKRFVTWQRLWVILLTFISHVYVSYNVKYLAKSSNFHYKR